MTEQTNQTPAYYLASSVGVALQETIDEMMKLDELSPQDGEVLLVRR